jgi:molecular chaperone GrpE
VTYDRQGVAAPERKDAAREDVQPGSNRAPEDDLDPDEILGETEAQLRRTLADLDNLRKRYEREVTRERADERARAARQWLSVVDDLERALEHADAEDAFTAGVRAVHQHALSLLGGLGFPRFDDIGMPFDPVRDEAIGTVESDAPPGTVVTALRPGYGSGEAVLRPAAVIVAKPG